MQNTVFLGTGLMALVAISVWTSAVVVRDQDLTQRQKWRQVLLAWLLPLLGPLLVLAVRHFTRRDRDRSAGDSTLVVDDQHYISKGYF